MVKEPLKALEIAGKPIGSPVTEENTPQVAMLVHREVMAEFDGSTRDWLEQCLGSHVFREFCSKNLAVVERDTAALEPGNDAQKFFQISKDMRLVRRFWIDLLRFAEELKTR